MLECAFIVGNGNVQFLSYALTFQGILTSQNNQIMDCRFFQILRRGPIMTGIC